MFRAFGHENSSVLDGGLPRWEIEGLPLDTDTPKGKKKTFYPTPVLDRDTLRSEDSLTPGNQTSSIKIYRLRTNCLQFVSESCTRP